MQTDVCLQRLRKSFQDLNMEQTRTSVPSDTLTYWGIVDVVTITITYSIHVDAVCVGPGMLEVLFQSLTKAPGDLVESDELFDSQHLRVVARGARVQPLDDG